MKLKVPIKKKLQLLFIFLAGGVTFYFLIAKFGFLMPLREVLSVACFSSCQSEKSFHPSIKGENLLNYEKSLQQLLEKESNREGISILVEKSKFRLTIFSNLKPLKSYPIVLGSSPTGDKLHEGDRKTPEGVYYIRDLYPHPSWSKFIWIDYPRPESWREHFLAKFSGHIDWQLPIGGEIGIHGVPAGQNSLIEKRLNWTLGCISLKNHDVDEIYSFVDTGTVVEIIP
ncbi:MAG: L,D-transpeptidase [Okeania sp. SIO3B5]|uniref:L,D-transpeptidase family protein n=1 Tax=Okeania sp. SIO3B5 TaxID=2607811 RepID=UPI0013FF0AF4|nr:L,D-transpeptidase [Okeania sp. SIO3B5]NEO58424.1 L,D-transpeptidase [Okeania sp. SIO3B5]